MSQEYKPSYYNLVIRHSPWTLLFNGVTAGLMRLPQYLTDELLPFLGPARPRTAGCGLGEWECKGFELEEVSSSIQAIFGELVRGRFFIPSDENETENLKERYEYYRRNDPFLVTLTTTLDCNLGCYYCYEDRSKVYLTRGGCDRILAWIQEQIATQGHDRLYTDWYGGEPMLNQDAIEYFSAQAIAYCDANNIGYSSAMISNGTLWPEDAAGFVQRTRIRDVQFTLDGPRPHHNKRRRYVAKTGKYESSFDRIVETIDRLIGVIRIYLRINVDPWVGREALSLVEFLKEKGWLAPGARVYPYLAMIGPMTEHCSFLGTSPKVRSFRQEFDTLDHEFQLAVGQYIDPRNIQHLQYYPRAVNINCAAVGRNSVIFGPDGLMYKCGLEVGDAEKSHDRLPNMPTASTVEQKDSPFVILNNLIKTTPPHRWEEYDPFRDSRCGQCQYMPICLGGCPKAHFDRDGFYLAQQCKYWEENFDTIIRTYHATTARRPMVEDAEHNA